MLVACSNDEIGGSSEGSKITLSPAEQEIAVAARDFQVDFFKSACATSEDENENIVVSPLSASVLTSMLANAANEEAASEIVEAMGCGSMEELNRYNATVLGYLPTADKNVHMQLENSVWHHSAYTLRGLFSSSMTDFYSADTYSRDFSRGDAVEKEVDKWCASNTGNLINGMDLDISDDSPIVLLNALSFNGKWTKPFDPSNTERRLFKGSKGSNYVQMMNIKNEQMLCLSTDYFKVAKKTFGKNDAYSVMLILPEEGVDVNEAAQRIDLKVFNENAKYVYVTLTMPKFKIEGDRFDLRDVLKGMSINSVFEKGLAIPFTTDVEVEWVVNQKTFVEFDEEGAKSSAVTSGEPDLTASQGKFMRLLFDRPFLFLVTERNTGSVISAGRIMNL